MAGTPVFVDTVALLALVNRDDALHAEAERVHEELTTAERQLVTSDWVLAEFLSAAARRPLREAASRVVQRLRQSRHPTVVPASREGWLRAFELFCTRRDKEWSFIDCTSTLLCEAEGIQEVFTQDRHFVQAGLRVLLK